MSFQQGLSGLNAAAKSLEVVGNNIANSSTVGFKGSQAQFADIYASSVNSSGNQAGIGVGISQIAQQFTQGNIESSANPLDMAINGSGFFRTEVNGTIQYSRNGQFSLDKQGFIVNAQGAQLTGFQADASGNILPGAPGPLRIDNSDLAPLATSNVTASSNLDSRSVAPVVKPFSSANPLSFNRQSSINIFDSLGNSHVFSTFYVKQDPSAGLSTWDVYGAVDGVDVINTPATGSAGSLTFDQNGILAAGSPIIFPVTYPANGALSSQPLTANFTGTTQFGSASSEKASTQDGYTAGQLTRFGAGADGVITAQYSNGQSHALGQVVLANFINPNGLTPLGSNAWSETSASGVPLVGTPGTGRLGALQPTAVESSNVDLTAELVNLITAQRAYQANAQTIKTQDSILQTLVSLR